jgi:hypothetical protein
MSEDSSFDGVKAGGFLSSVIASGAGAAIDLAILDGLGATLTPAIQAVSNLAGRALEDRGRRAVRAMDAAREHAGRSGPELIEALLVDEKRTELAVRALPSNV